MAAAMRLMVGAAVAALVEETGVGIAQPVTLIVRSHTKIAVMVLALMSTHSCDPCGQMGG